jgi:hypothetical protein
MDMSKMGSWVFEMQEDALELNRQDFVDRYGTAHLSVWDEVNGFGWDEQPAVTEEFVYYGS